jgi:flagellar basal-body rod protein FlgB
MGLNDIFGVHGLALEVRSRRAELLAANLANADTPGYKARDIRFQDVLSAANGDSVTLDTTDPRDLGGGSSGGLFGTDVLYRVPMQPSLDGNTVDTQVEEEAFMKNAVQYQTSLQFLDSRIKTLQLALKGQ